jgi:hypothetical protein
MATPQTGQLARPDKSTQLTLRNKHFSEALGTRECDSEKFSNLI